MGTRFIFSSEAAAFISVFILAVIAGPILIPVLRRLKFGQTVRDDGPATHLKKTGTPNIGGLIFLIPMVLVTLYFSRKYPQMLPILFATLGFGAVGFVDDFIKVVKKRKDGLNAKQKSLGLLLVAIPFTLYAAFSPATGTEIIVPFLGMNSVLTLPMWLYIPFTVLVLYFVTNSVNLTDGIDGLCAGITLIVLVFLATVAAAGAGWDYIKLFCAIAAGGCLGFLVFNLHPAKVFMGDTGSLALGGAVCTVCVIMKMPWLIFLVGAIYVVESLSVIIQVTSFKLRGKRVFKMAPIHHHFELLGWKETKVVKVFWAITLILCFIGFISLRFKFY